MNVLTALRSMHHLQPQLFLRIGQHLLLLNPLQTALRLQRVMAMNNCAVGGMLDPISSSRFKSVSTPKSSSVARSENTIQFSPSHIVAVTEGRGNAKGEVGAAAIDIESPTVELFQFNDDPIYNSLVTVLQSLNPLKIVLPSTIYEKSPNLLKLLRSHFEQVEIVSFDRKFFNENQGLDCFHRLCHREFTQVLFEIREKYYCLSALAAVAKYAEFVQRVVYHSASLAFFFTSHMSCMKIQYNSVTQLELIRNMSNPKSRESLFGILNHCKTPGGQKMLRTNLLVPPKDLDTILDRQQVVEELVANEEFLNRLRTRLVNFSDLYKLLNICVRSPLAGNGSSAANSDDFNQKLILHMLQLKACLESVPSMLDCIKFGRSKLFQTAASILADGKAEKLSELVRRNLIREDVHAMPQGSKIGNDTSLKISAVKSEGTSLLSALRLKYNQIWSDALKLCEKYETQLNNSLKLKLKWSQSSFSLQVCNKPLPPNLPSIFINVTRTGASIKCTTKELEKFGPTVKDLESQIFKESAFNIRTFLKQNVDNFGVLHRLAVAISLIDMLASLSYCSLENKWTKPTFHEYLKLNGNWHPMLGRSVGADRVVSNDVYMWEHQNFALISGPNMSGKTVFLKQLAVTQILAQMGSFIPAEREGSVVRLMEHLFFISGSASDSSAVDECSQFESSVRQMIHMLKSKSEISLVLVDEMGQCTSEEDGVALLFALSTMLCTSKCYSVISTHYLQLAEIGEMFLNASCFHFEVLLPTCARHDNNNSQADETKTELEQRYEEKYTYKLKMGFTKDVLYGIRIAEATNWPKEITQLARKYAEQELRCQSGTSSQYSQPERISSKKLDFLLQGKLNICIKNWSIAQERLDELKAVLEDKKEKGDFAWILEPLPDFGDFSKSGFDNLLDSLNESLPQRSIDTRSESTIISNQNLDAVNNCTKPQVDTLQHYRDGSKNTSNQHLFCVTEADAAIDSASIKSTVSGAEAVVQLTSESQWRDFDSSGMKNDRRLSNSAPFGIPNEVFAEQNGNQSQDITNDNDDDVFHADVDFDHDDETGAFLDTNSVVCNEDYRDFDSDLEQELLQEALNSELLMNEDSNIGSQGDYDACIDSGHIGSPAREEMDFGQVLQAQLLKDLEDDNCF
ncbi:mutS protein homolog 4-like [Convolutriloba macropyga]|uniref:mutS protein homolog 4-like n=1 Tax=Convolutriloba macropyga TaxID=536237 RepID=UPI003F51E8E1